MAEKLSLVAAGGGQRLDQFVSGKHPALSRSLAQKLIKEGLVTVSGRPEKASYRLLPGEKVEIVLPPPPESHLQPEDIPLPIIYEDDDILVIDKPAGLTTHPAPGHPEHTLVNALLGHFPVLPGSRNPLRPGIVHRLDKDTSGLMVVAKNQPALLNLSAQFKDRQVKKTYLALVKGEISPKSGAIEAPIGRDPGHRQRMAVTSGGRPARTGYRVLRVIGGYSLLELRPETGRTHQIRVHLAAIGHPVVGDATYGGREAFAPRQFLHARSLAFRLPSSGQPVSFTADLPADLTAVLDYLERASSRR